MTDLPNLIDDPIHLSSRFLLRRNIARHPFPHKLSSQNGARLLSLIPKAISLSSITPQEREQRTSLFQIQGGFQEIQEGQGLISTPTLLTLINHQEHLSFYGISSASTWSQTHKALLEIEKTFSTLFPFAYHPKFGFLTSCLDECGSAFTYTIDLHLPLLHRLGHLESALKEELETGVTLSSAPGDFISISNKPTLGISEEHILHTVNASAQHLKRAELALREHIGEHKEIKDLIARAFGLLQSSLQLELSEAIDALSLLILGLQLGIFKGMTPQELFSLTFLSRREFLQTNPKEDLLEKRASFLKEKLATLKPSIYTGST
jgi:protein arginine kinase